MDNKIEDKDSMYAKVLAFCGTNSDAIILRIPIFGDVRDELYDRVSYFRERLVEANQNNTGYAAQKEAFRIILRDKCLEFSGALKSLFLMAKDLTAANKVIITKSEFDKLMDGEIMTTYSDLNTATLDNAVGLAPFGFDALRIAGLASAFTAYNNLRGQPGDERSQSAAARRDAYDGEEAVDDELEIMDGIMQSAVPIFGSLSRQYFFDRRIDDSGGPNIPPDYILRIEPGQFLTICDIAYMINRSFRMKNLSADSLLWGLSITEGVFSNPPAVLEGYKISNLLSSTLGDEGNFLVVHNTSANAINIEVTLLDH